MMFCNAQITSNLVVIVVWMFSFWTCRDDSCWYVDVAVLVLFLCSINANVCTMFRYDSVISQHCHINFFYPRFPQRPSFFVQPSRCVFHVASDFGICVSSSDLTIVQNVQFFGLSEYEASREQCRSSVKQLYISNKLESSLFVESWHVLLSYIAGLLCILC